MSFLVPALRSRLRFPRPSFRRPARVVFGAFAAVIAAGAVLLSLPAASAGDAAASPITALFTATSAVCVTGLIVVDTPSYWSTFGELVILGLIQVGGFGIMTLASLLGLVVARRMSLRLQISSKDRPWSGGRLDHRGPGIEERVDTGASNSVVFSPRSPSSRP